ncbi:hypothetical protein PIB30_030367 [Stylosanthes scabra]|uniref:Uncharacterized protein n=1 Tax=Stylosanthes scabra TaxID=79078 RepID=A0ABU6WF30_9FABA|nr:hypothetical protein [Stylosanthes scabra]
MGSVSRAICTLTSLTLTQYHSHDTHTKNPQHKTPNTHPQILRIRIQNIFKFVAPFSSRSSASSSASNPSPYAAATSSLSFYYVFIFVFVLLTDFDFVDTFVVDLNSKHEEGQLEEEMQDPNSIYEEGQFEEEKQDLDSINDVGQLEEQMEFRDFVLLDMNSIHEDGQLEEKMEFLCNVDEEYVPKIGFYFGDVLFINITQKQIEVLTKRTN